MSSKEREKIVHASRTTVQILFCRKAREAWIGPEACERLYNGALLTGQFDQSDPPLLAISRDEL